VHVRALCQRLQRRGDPRGLLLIAMYCGIPARTMPIGCLWSDGNPKRAAASEDRPFARWPERISPRPTGCPFVSAPSSACPSRWPSRRLGSRKTGGGRIPRRRSAAFRGEELIRLELRRRAGQASASSARSACGPTAGETESASAARADDGAVRRLGHPPGGLFTFPQSPSTWRCTRSSASAADLDGGDVEAGEPPQKRGKWSTYTSSSTSLRQCSELTEEIFRAWIFGREILALRNRTWRDGSPSGGRICRVPHRQGSEAGSGVAYVKFGRRASRSRCASPARPASRGLRALAAERGCSKLVAGVNTSRTPRTAGWRSGASARFSTASPCSARTRPATTVPTLRHRRLA